MLLIMEIVLESLCQYKNRSTSKGKGRIEISIGGKAMTEERWELLGSTLYHAHAGWHENRRQLFTEEINAVQC